jgi:hypothetical protein
MCLLALILDRNELDLILPSMALTDKSGLSVGSSTTASRLVTSQFVMRNHASVSANRNLYLSCVLYISVPYGSFRF